MRKINAQFKLEVLTACIGALRAVGFVQYRKFNVDWPLDNKFRCWVGLNTAIAPSSVEINPFVGVHAVELMRFWASFAGERARSWKYDRAIATYAIHFGTLLPHEEVFCFTAETDIVQESRRLAQIYAAPGIDYARSIANYDLLLPLLLSKADTLGGYPERAAICMFLMRRNAELREFVGRFLAKNTKYLGAFDDTFMRSLAQASELDTPTTECNFAS